MCSSLPVLRRTCWSWCSHVRRRRSRQTEHLLAVRSMRLISLWRKQRGQKKVALFRPFFLQLQAHHLHVADIASLLRDCPCALQRRANKLSMLCPSESPSPPSLSLSRDYDGESPPPPSFPAKGVRRDLTETRKGKAPCVGGVRQDVARHSLAFFFAGAMAAPRRPCRRLLRRQVRACHQ